MDISDIEMLETIVTYGSINKASEVLHVTQPTLSKRVARLETKLGTPLFFRSNSGLTPTDHTQFIINRSKLIKTELRNIERHIALLNTLEEGDLKLGIGPIIEQLYFPHVLQELTKSPTSKLNIYIRTEAGDDLVNLLREGVIDLAIGPFDECKANDEYVVLPITSQPLMIATRNYHPLTEKSQNQSEITPEEVFNFPLIAPHSTKYLSQLFPILKEIGPSRIIFDNYSVIKSFLKTSDHICIGPGAVFHNEVQDESLTLLPLPTSITWKAACITRPESADLPIIKAVVEIFRNHPLPCT
ncbi:hypothetical protein R50073_18330 [Maricurvus nonylphenolicus]|uniref:LysR family transcriptional regulator n=1 Tax=Maricurvus nonylphenolicus TaxID=1008307 RepID=UPI0036F27D76